MIAVNASNKSNDSDEFVHKFWAEQKKLADAEGINVFAYLARANGGLLKPTIIKLLKHAQAHPNECPDDCAFQASIERLKEEYGVS